MHAQTALAAALMLAGLINLMPVIGVLGRAQLQRLYGMGFDDAGLRVLMRHRAVLFGLLGGGMVAAAWLPDWRLPAAAAGLISMLAFVALALVEKNGGAAIRRLVIADTVASLLLTTALLWLYCS